MSGPTVAGLILILALAGCGGDAEGQPHVTDSRMGRPTGPHAALYLTAHAYGSTDSLVGARTDAAGSVELHETVIQPDGSATMTEVTSMDLPSRGALVLEPGGLHIMLLDVDRLDAGATVEVTLVWERAGEQKITVLVVDPADTLAGGDDDDHGH